MGMFRLVSAVIITVLLVAFTMANTQHIELSFVFGKPVEIRLIFLLASTFVLGAATNALWMMARQIKKRKETRLARWSPAEHPMEDFKHDGVGVRS